MRRDELRRLTRDELLARAEALGVGRPAVLTQAELIDEMVKRDGGAASGMRGWLGRARDLVAQVVSKGLHLPDAATLFRGETPEPLPAPPPPLPTVTLAEIYAAQGHVSKAISVLERVLDREPTHALARELQERFEARLRNATTVTAEAAVARVEPSPPTLAPLEQTVQSDSSDDAPLGACTLEPTVAPMPQTVAGDSLDLVAGQASEALERSVAPTPRDAAPASIEATTLRAAHGSSPESPTDATPVHPRFQDSLVLDVDDSKCARVSWSLRPVRLARLQSLRPSGALVVRLFSVSPTATGLSELSVDIAVHGIDGELLSDALASESQVRCCLAWKDAEAFIPLVIGSPSVARVASANGLR